MRYEPPDRTVWRDVSDLRATERRASVQAWVILGALLCPIIVAAVIASLYGPVAAFLVVFVLMSWRRL